jgi:hypothetical protein
MQGTHRLEVYRGSHVNEGVFAQPLAEARNRWFPPLAGQAGFRFPHAQISISSQVLSADPSAPT